MNQATPKTMHPIFNATVIVSALGYFVDIYDLILFSVVRVASLKSIGIPDSEILESGQYLLNMQMTGMLLGGILWGVFGDKRGRISVLFGSILMYSLANIANGFVHDLHTYAVLRFIAGVGLAGELGAAITLVSEVLSKDHRGIGTAIVATVGITGAVAASLIGDAFEWRVAYIVGGVLGLLLLVLRITMFESGMYESLKSKSVHRGRFWMLFTSRERFLKYLSCILTGVPIWFVIGILFTLSPEISKELEVQGVVRASFAVMWGYIGLAVGDLASGLISHWLRSRRKVLFIFLSLTAILTACYGFLRGLTVGEFYFLCAALGFATGYWAIFVTVASEQFGTNLRATVTTTVPNFVRGSVVPLNFSFMALKESHSLPESALIVGATSLALAFVAWAIQPETFGKDLNYLEE